MSPTWDGLLLLDKPSGPTSHDVVARVRRVTGERRVGHAGTLDPLASGLLPLVLGRATRLVRFLPASPKIYEGTLILGLTTRTDDVAGEVVSRHTGTLPAAGRVLEAAGRLRGEYPQLPPAISARKVGGRRLYRLARQGVSVEIEPRMVRVVRFELQPSSADAATFGFATEVSSGTYVRSLVRDLGAALGCGAIVATLRRLAIGPMRPSARLTSGADLALDVDELRECLVTLDDMPLGPPRLQLSTAAQAARFASGAALQDVRSVFSDGAYRVVDERGRLLGVAEMIQGTLRPRVVLGPPAA